MTDTQVRPDTPLLVRGEEEFHELVNEMVDGEAPRLFAVVQEYREEGASPDGRVAAWGMAFEDHAEVVGVSDGVRMSLRKPDGATRLYGRRPEIAARIVWVEEARSRPPAAS